MGLLCKVFCSNSGQRRKVFVRSFRVEKVALSVAEAHNIAADFARAVLFDSKLALSYSCQAVYRKKTAF